MTETKAVQSSQDDPSKLDRKRKLAEQARLRRKKFPEKEREYQRRYYERLSLERKRKKWASLLELKERDPGYFKRHYEANKEQYYVRYKARLAAKKCLLHHEHDRSVELSLIREARRLSKLTGVPHEVDHVIPLKCGGWHHHENLQVLPRSVNRSKGDNPTWTLDGYKTWRDVPRGLWPAGLCNQYQSLIKENEQK